MLDPLRELSLVELQSFDIPRLITVYPDKALERWWTRAWFNNSKSGEWAQRIEYQTAVDFIKNIISKEEMLETYYPKQMKIYHDAIIKTKEQLLSSQLNIK